MAPLIGGISCPIGRRDKNLEIFIAVDPAMKRGNTCPVPKHPSKTIPVIGLPVCAIQPNRTAKTGVVQGDAASPNAKPAAKGAKVCGTLFFQRSGSGPVGSGIFIKPNRFKPIKIARIATNVGINEGT